VEFWSKKDGSHYCIGTIEGRAAGASLVGVKVVNDNGTFCKRSTSVSDSITFVCRDNFAPAGLKVVGFAQFDQKSKRVSVAVP
jgi:hypothetical protein